MEIWREVRLFPGYSVNSAGLVRNDRTEHILARLINQNGVAYVGLVRDGEQYNRTISRLVADEFLPAPQYPSFDTPINLDGDRTRNTVENLMWRPRWFAMKYHQQFKKQWDEAVPIREVESGIQFDGVLLAAVEYGLLALEIFLSAMNYTYYKTQAPGVWPTGQYFEIMQKIHINTLRNRGL